MEQEAIYRTTNEIRPRDACLRPKSDWAPPTGGEIKATLQLAGWSGVYFSRVVDVDPRTVRRWTGDEKTIAYPAWALLCVQAGLGHIWTH